MASQKPDDDTALIQQPGMSFYALRNAVTAIAPGRLPEMIAKMQDAFELAGEGSSIAAIRMFYREWAVIVEIERHPATARRLHVAEQALTSDDAEVRAAAIREAGEIVRAAHAAVAGR